MTKQRNTFDLQDLSDCSGVSRHQEGHRKLNVRHANVRSPLETQNKPTKYPVRTSYTSPVEHTVRTTQNPTKNTELNDHYM